MPEETLFTAARRAVRDFDIDMNKGGLMTEATQQSFATLNKMVLLEAAQDRSNVVQLPQDKLYQARIQQWVLDAFGEWAMKDIEQRCQRFLEEALELVQANGMSQADVLALVEYVFNRPTGDANQEVGGVMVTLAALCAATGVDLLIEGEKEYARISQPEVMSKIRAKQATKPFGSPLPGKTPDEPKIQKFVTHDGTITVSKAGE